MFNNNENINCNLKCDSCSYIIDAELDLCEFMNKYYHKACFKCYLCMKQFCNQNDLAYLDKYGKLICFEDFVSSLKCSICLNGFQLNSNICQVVCETTYSKDNTKKSNVDDDILAHYECMSCMKCHCKINALNEYSYNSNKNLLQCKVCTLSVPLATARATACHENEKNKKLKKLSVRLSTRQKQLINIKFGFIDDVDKFMDFKDEIYSYANEIGCSRKSINDYVVRFMNRVDMIEMPTKSDCSNESHQSVNKSQIEHSFKTTFSIDMVEQLTKLDKTLAPNRNPFYENADKNNNTVNNGHDDGDGTYVQL